MIRVRYDLKRNQGGARQPGDQRHAADLDHESRSAGGPGSQRGTRSRAQGRRGPHSRRSERRQFCRHYGPPGIYPDLPPMPVVPGYEVSGRIDAMGAGVDGSWAGRDVLAVTRFGGYADVGLCSDQPDLCAPCEYVGIGGRGPSRQLFHGVATCRGDGRLESRRNRPRFIRRAAASVLLRPRLPSISAPGSLERLRPASTPSCARSASIISSTIEPRISKPAPARSPMAAASNLFSMRSAASRGRKAIACSRRRDASACSASPLRPPVRTAMCCRCCRQSRTCRGFNSTRCR